MTNARPRKFRSEGIDEDVPIVYIVEDDCSMRLALTSLLGSVACR